MASQALVRQDGRVSVTMWAMVLTMAVASDAWLAEMAIGAAMLQSGINVWQNGRRSGETYWRTKGDVVAAWTSAEAPLQTPHGRYVGILINRGAAAPTSAFITHWLFPPLDCSKHWLGKDFDYLQNWFQGERLARPFAASISHSNRDGRPTLVLVYHGFWGKIVGMRDELRQLEPGVLLGLGSMRATGGRFNSAPFLLAADATALDNAIRRYLLPPECGLSS